MKISFVTCAILGFVSYRNKSTASSARKLAFEMSEKHSTNDENIHHLEYCKHYIPKMKHLVWLNSNILYFRMENLCWGSMKWEFWEYKKEKEINLQNIVGKSVFRDPILKEPTGFSIESDWSLNTFFIFHFFFSF